MNLERNFGPAKARDKIRNLRRLGETISDKKQQKILQEERFNPENKRNLFKTQEINPNFLEEKRDMAEIKKLVFNNLEYFDTPDKVVRYYADDFKEGLQDIKFAIGIKERMGGKLLIQIEKYGGLEKLLGSEGMDEIKEKIDSVTPLTIEEIDNIKNRLPGVSNEEIRNYYR